MTKLYIDDIRDPKSPGWVVVRSYAEAVGWMRQNGCPQYISFDHDLGMAGELSGFDIAKWMVERDMNANGQFIPVDFDFNVHSANPVGSGNIASLLENYLRYRKENDL